MNIRESSQVDGRSIPNSYVISSAGAPDRRDNLHFNAEGYRLLGTRYAVKMLSLLGYEVDEPELPTTPADTD